MQLTIIGSSPAWPNPGGAHAGYLVESEGCGRLLLDCGPGVLSRLRERGLDVVDAIAISHMHLDHWGDLVPWAWFTLHGGGREVRTELAVPPGGQEDLEAFAARWGSPGMFDRAFDLHEYGVRDPLTLAGFELEAIGVEHFGDPAHGLRVRDPHGRLLAYSGDSGPCEGLRQVAAGADLFLCEATLASAHQDGTPRGHLTAEDAMSYATGRVVLTHRPADLGSVDGTLTALDGETLDV